MMAGPPSLMLLCLQALSLVLANMYPSARGVHRRSPEQTPKPSGYGKHSRPTAKAPHPKTTGAPFGFGAGVTGGGDADPQIPKDPAQLEAWLTDSVPRVIFLDKTYDFGTTNTTSKGCRPWKSCPSGQQTQQAMNFDNWCSREKQLASNIEVSLVAAPLTPIRIKSRKTLRGVGRAGVIKGKGLFLYRTENVIIQNVHITWLNPEVVWGGDALTMDGAKDIWIDHCSFSHIGRQMLATGGMAQVEANKGITLSNNLFSGKTEWSNRCHNHHYWVALLTGPDDQITMARNCVDSTSGRSPKTGGSGNPKVVLHYYNNLHTNTLGQIFEIGRGSNVLAEGNYFDKAKTQYPSDRKTDDGGQSYVPFRPEEASRCNAILGRPCVTNLMSQSSPYRFGLDFQAVNAFKAFPAVTRAKVVPASSIAKEVPGLCGVGYI